MIHSYIAIILDSSSNTDCARPSILLTLCVHYAWSCHIHHEQEKFEATDFETTIFLGTGSFGRVTLVKFKDPARQDRTANCRCVCSAI
jgi:hypothetical protein